MDVLYPYRGQMFVWDGRKAIVNRKKHGVRSEEACGVFFDPIQETEDASVENELRLGLIGMTVNEEMLYVVHLEREGELIRIISAREASGRERRLYENGS